jgi:hypothetical protein
MIYPALQIEALTKEFAETTNQMRIALSWDNIEGVEECAIYAVGLAKAIRAIKTKRSLSPLPPVQKFSTKS